MRLSVIMPVFNEEHYIEEIVRRVRAVGLAHEIIIVDDRSTDNTRTLLETLSGLAEVRVLYHEQNQGKSATVRTGLRHATGDVVLIQDADLEYEPQDYYRLLAAIEKEGAQVVYGSRFLEGRSKAVSPLQQIANRFLTFLTNLLFGSTLTDVQTCYKCFTVEVASRIDIQSRGWGFDPEITAQILKLGYRIREVPIAYEPRGYDQGKKIKGVDSLIIIWTLLKYRFLVREGSHIRLERWTWLLLALWVILIYLVYFAQFESLFIFLLQAFSKGLGA